MLFTENALFKISLTWWQMILCHSQNKQAYSEPEKAYSGNILWY